MPSLMSEKEMRDLFGVDHQGMYEVRDTYIIPYLATLGPGGVSLSCLVNKYFSTFTD